MNWTYFGFVSNIGVLLIKIDFQSVADLNVHVRCQVTCFLPEIMYLVNRLAITTCHCAAVVRWISYKRKGKKNIQL